MIIRFFRGFLEGMQEAIVPSMTVPLSPLPPFLPPPMPRPSKKKMKVHLEAALKERRSQYRFSFKVAEQTYHAIYAYVRGARYTLVFEYVGKKKRFPKLVCFFNGKPTRRHLREETWHAVRERQKRIDRSFTMERLAEQEVIRLSDKASRARKATNITGGTHGQREQHAGSHRRARGADACRTLAYCCRTIGPLYGFWGTGNSGGTTEGAERSEARHRRTEVCGATPRRVPRAEGGGARDIEYGVL